MNGYTKNSRAKSKPEMFIRMSEVNQPTKLMERGIVDDSPPQNM